MDNQLELRQRACLEANGFQNPYSLSIISGHLLRSVEKTSMKDFGKVREGRKVGS